MQFDEVILGEFRGQGEFRGHENSGENSEDTILISGEFRGHRIPGTQY